MTGEVDLREVPRLVHACGLARRPGIHRHNHGPVLVRTGKHGRDSEQKKEKRFHSEVLIVV